MAVLRPHLALTVTDVERATPLYEALLGTPPTKIRPGYANFEVAEPALNFTLNRGDRGRSLGAFNHAGNPGRLHRRGPGDEAAPPEGRPRDLR